MSKPKIPNAFTVTFVEGYIETLIQQVGPDQAITRLIEEGTVALTNEVTRLIRDVEQNPAKYAGKPTIVKGD